MKKNISMLICFLLLILIFQGGAINIANAVTTPHYLGYEGRLTNSSDEVLTGTHSITFKIYDALSGGNLLWTEIQNGVSVSGGYFSVNLGDTTALNLSFDRQYWISLEIEADGEMTPRSPINSVGYSYASDVAYGTYATTTAPTTTTTGSLYFDTGNGNLYVYDNIQSSWVDLTTQGNNGLWADSANSLLVSPLDSNDVVLIGGAATTTTGNIFEVIGSSLFDDVVVDGQATLGNASLSALTVSGNTLLTGATDASILNLLDSLTLASNIPFVTTNALYNNGGTLMWDGSAMNGAISGAKGQVVTFDSNGLQVATSTLFISDAGNVGIGTSLPSEKLDVWGKIAVNGTALIYLPDQTDFSGTMYFGNGDGGSSLSHVSGNDGKYNLFIGSGSGNSNTRGYSNTASGYSSLYSNTTGYNNTAFGYSAGRYIANGTTPNQTGNDNLFLGSNTMALADGDTNEIVIGHNAIGLGSSTMALGNTALTLVAPTGDGVADLGNTSHRWKSVYSGALHIGVDGDEGVLSYNTTENTFDFSQGLKLGISSSTAAGSLRWSGADFEGHDGTSWSVFGGGSGDMLKATYDVDNDGIVDEVGGEQAALLNETEDLLHSMSNKQQSLEIVASGSVVYLYVEAVDGGDIEYNIDGVERVLDCTTGSGVGGRARVIIPQGTATTIHRSMVYVFYDEQADALSLATTRSQPAGAYAPVATVGIQDAATVNTEGPAIFQRTTEALEHNGRGAISWMREKLRVMGAEYEGGIDQSLEITANGSSEDNVNFITTSGSVFQLHRQQFPAYSIDTDGLWVSNASGDGVLSKLQKVTDMNALHETADGTALVDGDIVNLVIWGNVNYSASNARLNVNLPTDVYRNVDNAKNDINNYAVTSIPTESKTTGFLIARVVLQYSTASGGTWTNALGDSSTVWVSESRNTSSNNYPSNYSNSTTEGYTIIESGASRVRLRFDAFNTEANYDYVKLSNGTGGTLFTYHGNLGAFTTGVVSGSRIDIDFTSDGSVTRPGFHVSAIEYETTVLTGTKVIDLRGSRGGIGGSSGGTTASEEFEDSIVRIFDNVDTSKKLAFEVSAITTGTTRTISVPNGDGAVGLFTGLAGGQTLIGGTSTVDGLTLQTTSGVGTAGADMHFLTGNNGSTEALTILNNGNMGVGTTSPGQRLQIGVSGDGSVALANAWNTFSDGRWKKNVRILDNSLNKILRLDGVSYDWKNGGTIDNIGFIAQDLRVEFPQAVSEDSNGFLSVSYAKMVVPIVEAIKEIWNKVTGNSSDIIDLKSENTLLKSELCAENSSYSWCVNNNNYNQDIEDEEEVVDQDDEQNSELETDNQGEREEESDARQDLTEDE